MAVDAEEVSVKTLLSTSAEAEALLLFASLLFPSSRLSARRHLSWDWSNSDDKVFIVGVLNQLLDL